MKILSGLLAVNSVALFAMHYDEIKNTFASVVNFSITIAEGTGQQPEKPAIATPQNGEQITFPYSFRLSNLQNPPSQYKKVRWEFRWSNGIYEFPALMMETGNNLTQFTGHSEYFPAGQTNVLFMRARLQGTDDQWGEYSDEVSFTTGSGSGGGTVATSSGGGYTGGYGGGGSGSSGAGNSVGPQPTQQTITPAAKPAAAPKKPAKKSVKEPSVKIKIYTKKVKKGKDVKIKPMKSLKPARKKPVTAPKPQNIKIQIKKKNDLSTIPKIQQKQAIPAKKTPVKKSIKKSGKLGVGSYTAMFEFEEDGTRWVYSEDFEVVPNEKNHIANFLVANELTLSFLLLGCSAIIPKKPKKRKG